MPLLGDVVLNFLGCNCHNHTTDCYYDERIAQEKRSLDIHGNYEGGGVCVNCQHNTDGINCENCKPGYYHPTGVPKTSFSVCQGIVFLSSTIFPKLKTQASTNRLIHTANKILVCKETVVLRGWEIEREIDFIK